MFLYVQTRPRGKQAHALCYRRKINSVILIRDENKMKMQFRPMGSRQKLCFLLDLLAQSTRTIHALIHRLRLRAEQSHWTGKVPIEVCTAVRLR